MIADPAPPVITRCAGCNTGILDAAPELQHPQGLCRLLRSEVAECFSAHTLERSFAVLAFAWVSSKVQKLDLRLQTESDEKLSASSCVIARSNSTHVQLSKGVLVEEYPQISQQR